MNYEAIYPYKLPRGWMWTNISAIASLIRGVSYPKEESSKEDKDRLMPILRATNISGELNFNELVYVPRERVNDEQLVRAFDVLIAMSSGSKDLVGKAAQADRDLHLGFGAFCGLVRITPELDRRFVGFFFNSPRYRSKISGLSSGVNINNLRKDDIESMPIPLPPLSEQRRIVAKIEDLFTKLDTGVDDLKKIKAQLKRYRQSILKSAFEGALTSDWRQARTDDIESAAALLERIKQERRKSAKGKYKEMPFLDTSDLPALPDGWAWTSGDIVFSFVTSGSRGWAKYYSESGAAFLRMGNLDHESTSLDLDSVQRVSPPPSAEGFRTRVIAGDILISITADVGMIALIPAGFEEAYINQHVALARPVSAIIKPYVAWFLSSREGGQNQLLKLQRGATKVGLGLDDIRAINIPIAPIIEQRQIVEEIERSFSIADQIEKTVDHSLKQAERLRQSIFKRAFEGKLVPQDPSDEPAEMLLDRIKAEGTRHLAEVKASRKIRKRHVQKMRLK